MPRKYVKKLEKRPNVIVANPKTPEDYGKMINDLNKVFRELHSIREVDNTLFKEKFVYYRNALVRSNYFNKRLSIKEAPAQAYIL